MYAAGLQPESALERSAYKMYAAGICLKTECIQNACSRILPRNGVHAMLSPFIIDIQSITEAGDLPLKMS